MMATTRHRARARREQYFAYSGPSTLITDLSAQIRGPKDGLFVQEMRILSRAEVLLNGQVPETFSASTAGPQTVVGVGRRGRPENPLHDGTLLRTRWELAGNAVARWRLELTNHTPARRESFELRLELDADFADTHEVERGERRQCAAARRTVERDRLTLASSHPNLSVAAVISITESSSPAAVEEGGIVMRGELGPQESARLEVEVRREPAFLGAVVRHAEERVEGPRGPKLTTRNRAVSAAWDTAIADLRSLPLGMEGAPVAVSAGVPIYQHFFGRDTLTAGWQALMAGPEYLRDALIANAMHQGERVDDWLDEQPGKMIHEARAGPLSLLGEDPLARNYGDYATPPDFVAMLAQYWAWTGDRATTERMLPAAWKALEWLELYGDLDQDGFLEYVTRSPKGVKNQGWKDAGDSIVNDDGSIAENPLATSELQGYWYSALQLGAFLAATVGRDFTFAAALLKKSRALRARFNEAFWLDGQGRYALALDSEKKLIHAAGSNDAHLLATGIVPRGRARRVAARLFEPDIFTGWGIRTLSSKHLAYHPFSYHRGSVWPVEHGTFAFGLARYGLWAELHHLAKAFFEMTELFEDNRLPEVVGGLQREAGTEHPGVYPDACAPQAWSASAVVQIVQAMLGLNPWVPFRVVAVDPHLPPWLGEVWLRGIRVADSEIDLHAWRERDGRTRYRVRKRGGGRMAIVRQPPPQDLDTSIWGRMLAVMGR